MLALDVDIDKMDILKCTTSTKMIFFTKWKTIKKYECLHRKNSSQAVNEYEQWVRKYDFWLGSLRHI